MADAPEIRGRLSSLGLHDVAHPLMGPIIENILELRSERQGRYGLPADGSRKPARESVSLRQEEENELREVGIEYRRQQVNEIIGQLRQVEETLNARQRNESELRLLVDVLTRTPDKNNDHVGTAAEDAENAIRSVFARHGLTVPEGDSVTNRINARNNPVFLGVRRHMTQNELEKEKAETIRRLEKANAGKKTGEIRYRLEAAEKDFRALVEPLE